mgnify:FL=1|tara:strand:+ start:123 stop:911 length:789 start_codon:yes stop_codon:yes gene_type:complete
MIGIVGNGFVGNAVYQNFRDKVSTKVYDVDKNKSYNTLLEVLECDYIFVCLPTPMRSGGECDLSILDDFFESVPDYIAATFIIKSTVPVGTTKKYSERHNVIHNPEFLTARNAVQDFANSERNVIGGDPELCRDFAKLFSKCFPKIPNIMVSSDESEAIKYFSNTFLACKVAYFNKMYDFCVASGMNYDMVCDGVIADSRIGRSHTQVPGIDNDRGFGGTCFPKDLNSLVVQMESKNINADILKEVWKYNEEIRKVIDWPVT